MNEHNAINPETGETVYIGILDKLPNGFVWIHDLKSTDDWIKVVRAIKKQELARLTELAGHSSWDGLGQTVSVIHCEYKPIDAEQCAYDEPCEKCIHPRCKNYDERNETLTNKLPIDK